MGLKVHDLTCAPRSVNADCDLLFAAGTTVVPVTPGLQGHARRSRHINGDPFSKQGRSGHAAHTPHAGHARGEQHLPGLPVNPGPATVRPTGWKRRVQQARANSGAGCGGPLLHGEVVVDCVADGPRDHGAVPGLTQQDLVLHV